MNKTISKSIGIATAGAAVLALTLVAPTAFAQIVAVNARDLQDLSGIPAPAVPDGMLPTVGGVRTRADDATNTLNSNKITVGRIYDCENYNDDLFNHPCNNAALPPCTCPYHSDIWNDEGVHCSEGYAFYVSNLGWKWNDRAFSAVALDGCKKMDLYWDAAYGGSMMECTPGCKSLDWMDGEASSLKVLP